MMLQPELLECLGPPASLESSPCPLDDTVVGQRRHRSESTTGRGSDSQSVIGTYRTPVSDPANHILGFTVLSVSLRCVLLSLWFPISSSLSSSLLASEWPEPYYCSVPVGSVAISSSGLEDFCFKRKVLK